MDEVLSATADKDTAAKDALWQAIQLLAQELKVVSNVDTYLRGKGSRPLTAQMPRPVEHLWKLVEILSVLTMLKDADQVLASSVYHLLGRLPEPVKFIKRAEPCYLWTQRAMGQSRSGFAGIPDITITSTDEVPSRANALDVIEAKSGRISSRLIRQEFAKGYDLKIKSYCIWSYQQPTKAQIDGAALLGIDLEPLGFDAAEDMREKWLDPTGLIAQFSKVLTERRDVSRFEMMLRQSASESNDKRRRTLPQR